MRLIYGGPAFFGGIRRGGAAASDPRVHERWPGIGRRGAPSDPASRGGDPPRPAGQRALVDEFRVAVVSLAFQILGSQADAEDVAQETFLRVFQKLAEFREESRFFSWLYRITTNAALDRLRRRRALPTSYREDLPAWAPEEESESDRETRLMVWIAMERLPPEQRIALVLRELHGLSYEEIGEITGTPVGTIGSRIRAARQFLRHALRGALE